LEVCVGLLFIPFNYHGFKFEIKDNTIFDINKFILKIKRASCGNKMPKPKLICCYMRKLNCDANIIPIIDKSK